MLGFIINSIIRGQNPKAEEFHNLVNTIKSKKIFSGNPHRFSVNMKKVGKFTIKRTKSIIRGLTVYDIYENEHMPKGYDLSNKRIGYEICMSNDKLVKVYKKNNPVALNGGIELLIHQKRYI